MRSFACACVLSVIAVGSAASAQPQVLERDDLDPAPGETPQTIQIDLPAVPSFAPPAPNADGSHPVRELRVGGRALFDTDLAVRGVVTWAYDCVTDIRKPKETDAHVRKRIADDPTLCERAKFYVGDDVNTPHERSLWVVDVPRPYNQLELARIPKADRHGGCEPNDRTTLLCPPYKVGDQVLVVGHFAIASPHSERNSDGLLIYAAMQNATQKWQTTGGATIPPASATAPLAPLALPPELPAPPRVAMRKPVTASPRQDSIVHLNAGNKAMGARQIADAIAEYQRAVAAWDDNHLAWYGLGAAAGMTSDWASASDAFRHAVEVRPDSVMYQTWYGVALYERAVHDASAKQAVDLSAVNFDPALAHLRLAVKLGGAPWRAHYYLGRIFRERHDAKAAADAFTAAIRANPRQPNPYVALAELYRHWDYTDQAIEVAAQGTANLPATGDAADVWYVLGMAYDDKRLDTQALAAFTHALALKPDYAQAMFQRGQTYVRIRDFVHAKTDLEAFVSAANPSLAFAQQQATKMLMDIAAHPHAKR